MVYKYNKNPSDNRTKKCYSLQKHVEPKTLQTYTFLAYTTDYCSYHIKDI